MITLTAACAQAFAERQIRIEPVLQVSTDGGTTWTQVASSLLIGRPARSCSPLLSKTPVMRCDMEVIPTTAMQTLFAEGRVVKYQEVVNGQTFDRFYGNLERPENSWTVKNGVLHETMKVTAYSGSQRLAKLDYEVIWDAATEAGPTTTNAVILTMVVGLTSEMSYSMNPSDDSMITEHVFQPNAAPYAATITLETGGAVKVGGTDFTIIYRSGTNDLAVHWLTGMPANGVRYKITFWQLKGLMVPTTPSYVTLGSPTAAVSPVYAMTGDVAHCEFLPEMITQANLARKPRFSISQSFPSVYTRAGSAAGAPVEDKKAEEWTMQPTAGYMEPSPIAGAQGTHRIYAATQYVVTDVMLVAAHNLLWPDPVVANNALENALGNLYTGISMATNFAASGIALGDYRISGKGDVALKTLMANAPPNYLVYDDNSGNAVASLVSQAGTANFALTQVAALRDVALANVGQQQQATYTAARLFSTFATGVLVNAYQQDFIFGDFPAIDKGQWDTSWMAMFEENSVSTTAIGTTLDGVTGAYMMFCAAPACNIVEIVKTISIKFEGEIRVFRSTLSNASLANGQWITADNVPTAQYREYLNGYERLNADAGIPVTVTINVDALSAHGQGGPYPEQVWIEIRACSRCLTPKVYLVSCTIDRMVLAESFATDAVGVPSDSAWHQLSLADPLAPPPMIVNAKQKGNDFLLRWMLNYQASTVGVSFYMSWWRHRVYDAANLPSLPLYGTGGAQAIANATLDDIWRRATAKEADVVYEPQVQIGDTVAVTDPLSNTTYNRLVVGFRDNNDLAKPMTTLELADYT